MSLQKMIIVLFMLAIVMVAAVTAGGYGYYQPHPYRMFSKRVVVGLLAGSGSIGVIGTYYKYASDDHDKAFKGNIAAKVALTEGKNVRPKNRLPTRAQQIKNLKSNTEYDIVIIGGGATGAGIALDAVSRGLKTAIIEMDDFSSGTSSRSTKLIHGGVRYLQKAIMKFDYEQYKMVKEALRERANLLEIAPHLSYPLPIMLPVYTWWQIPYYWAGIKMYDLIAGRRNVKSSYFLSKKDALEIYPMLKKDNFCGAIVYYDGAHNDARMNLAIVLTAARLGAITANHVGVTSLLKTITEDGAERVSGVTVKDALTGEQWNVKSKCVINATGPFTDSIRKMDDQNVRKICMPSAGVHIVLPNYYSPDKMGLLDPATSDGRVIFFLPWQNATIAGTTDKLCEVSHNPTPSEEDIQFILNQIRNYLNPDVEVRRGDVLSAWSGIRPLVLDPNNANTESVARNHIIHVSDSGLITIAGGKWTTYRSMAEETIDTAVKYAGLETSQQCQTIGLLLEGAHYYTPTMFIRLVQDFGLENEVAQHLATTYGDRAFAVAKLAGLTGKRWPVVGRRLHEEFPYLEAEVKYAITEYACTAVDVIARRLRLAFLNVPAAEECLPKIIDIMSKELNWSKAEKKSQMDLALQFLNNDMGQAVNKESRTQTDLNFTKQEMNNYIQQFQLLDGNRKGYLTMNELQKSFETLTGKKISGDEMHSIMGEVDFNKNGQIELSEFLELMAAMKNGAISHNRIAKTLASNYDAHRISVERSGGGV
ncbi:Glycerol-3-phosphate dehydrogenase, mitochondrial [Nymphon striatum]|nr:Glycerol-3-phosphate dehydrogenase, mitochondrial [Nymphon striatum]